MQTKGMVSYLQTRRLAKSTKDENAVRDVMNTNEKLSLFFFLPTEQSEKTNTGLIAVGRFL